MSPEAVVTAVPAAAPVAQAAPGALPAGFRLREFRIERTLGEGGFGVVYEATDLKLERRVAIKEYMPAMLATRGEDHVVRPRPAEKIRTVYAIGLRSFINEAKLLARFEHPALVKVYQFWLDRGTGYMVMPLHTSPTLKTWVRHHPEPPPANWLRSYLLQTIDALALLHREQCLHRDVSPDNLLVVEDAHPLLLDFGAARQAVGREGQDSVMFKPGFAPLEQHGETAELRQGPWTDIYSLCAVGYFAITRRAPPSAVARAQGQALPSLAERAAGRYPPSLLAALDAGLALLPAGRPQSLEALRELLREPASAPLPAAPATATAPSAAVAAATVPAVPAPAAASLPATVVPAGEVRRTATRVSPPPLPVALPVAPLLLPQLFRPGTLAGRRPPRAARHPRLRQAVSFAAGLVLSLTAVLGLMALLARPTAAPPLAPVPQEIKPITVPAPPAPPAPRRDAGDPRPASGTPPAPRTA